MSSEALQVAKVYRNLLKAVVKHIGKEDKRRHFREYVTEEFRKNSIPSDLSSIPQKIKLAQDYTILLNSELLFSYNIAVDRSDEMIRVLGKSAASVGLQLPEVYQP
ncbi:Complex 1 LYR protein [Trema orientale]|uniref:Complex 1 LYR protein n=1 Tax=Trema orientale TaxID=63057 RepID=A0A2P5CTG1_TREOI|nr:Complex 1 LYR protein [Trema orientale]